MRLQFNIARFITRSLPLHKRQTNRYNLIWWVLREINSLWDTFVDWRLDMIYESNITGQKLSLVSLLNKEVTGSNDQIYIEEVNTYGLYLSLESEAQDSIFLSTLSEASDSVFIAKYGEISEALGVDFIIYIPTGANKAEVQDIADRYVLAQMIYTITEF